MFKPPPRKVVCKKCGRTKIVAPKSDCLSYADFPFCPKCKEFMDDSGKPLSPFDIVLHELKSRFFKKKPGLYKFVCKKCGRTKIVAPESDVSYADLPFCFKCKEKMTALYKIKKQIF